MTNEIDNLKERQHVILNFIEKGDFCIQKLVLPDTSIIIANISGDREEPYTSALYLHLHACRGEKVKRYPILLRDDKIEVSRDGLKGKTLIGVEITPEHLDSTLDVAKKSREEYDFKDFIYMSVFPFTCRYIDSPEDVPNRTKKYVKQIESWAKKFFAGTGYIWGVMPLGESCGMELVDTLDEENVNYVSKISRSDAKNKLCIVDTISMNECKKVLEKIHRHKHRFGIKKIAYIVEHDLAGIDDYVKSRGMDIKVKVLYP